MTVPPADTALGTDALERAGSLFSSVLGNNKDPLRQTSEGPGHLCVDVEGIGIEMQLFGVCRGRGCFTGCVRAAPRERRSALAEMDRLLQGACTAEGVSGLSLQPPSAPSQ